MYHLVVTQSPFVGGLHRSVHRDIKRLGPVRAVRWERQHVDPVRPAESQGLQRDVARVIVHQKEDGVVLACRRVADDVWQDISGEYLFPVIQPVAEFSVRVPGGAPRPSRSTGTRRRGNSRTGGIVLPSLATQPTEFSPFNDQVLARVFRPSSL